jgi:predicted component of type VI protein secretion system
VNTIFPTPDDFFNDLPVAILQWQGRWTDIVNPPKIGRDSQLGMNAIVIGQ